MAKVIDKALNSPNSYYVIALMSGTSLDGIDIAFIHFEKKTSWRYHLLHTNTYSYSEDWGKRLTFNPNLKATDLLQLNTDYSSLLSQLIEQFISDYRLDRSKINLIASHGHTLYHQPEKGFTLQIGNEPLLFTQTGIPVVCNFRKQDVALGGQGAPLVPIGDSLLFGSYSGCLNLGGFANISFPFKDNRIAFDICAVNFVLNQLSNQLGLDYDKGGEIARQGQINPSLVSKLDSIPYFSKQPPKSTGAEWVKEQVLPILNAYSISISDKLASFSAHCAGQIADCINQYTLSSVLVTGGGAYNFYLIELIQEKSSCKLETPNHQLIEFKEALIFGLMGVLRFRGEVNVLSSVTGAKYDHSSGIIYS